MEDSVARSVCVHLPSSQLNNTAKHIKEVMAVITFNKIRKIFNGKKEVIKATEPSSSIKEMVSLLVFLLRNLNCILLWNLVIVVKKSLYVSSNYFVFIFFSSLSTSILLLVIYNTFFSTISGCWWDPSSTKERKPQTKTIKLWD